MIPHTLTLTNFLSYRDTAVLDLRSVHLACITGLNGAGKSSLLDAITWVLFGKSRAGDDDVVNRIAAGKGQSAEVAFVFELEGAVYRIMRRKRPGRTKELEVYIQREEADGEPQWRVLTETKVTESQRVINDLLRMDYEVFTNASFLLQGKADEFTTKTPDKRKEILADILGVNVWDEYKARATERRKAAETELMLLNRQLEDIEAELTEEEERCRALEQAEAFEASVRGQTATQEELVGLLRQNRLRFEQEQAGLARVTTELAAADDELQRLTRRTAESRAQLAQHQALLDRRAAIEAEYVNYQAAVAEAEAWQEKYQRYEVILRQRHPLDTALERARARLESRRDELEAQRRLAALAGEQAEALVVKLASDRERLTALATQVEAAEAQEQAYREARERLTTLQAERRLMAQERDQLAAQASAAAEQKTAREYIAHSLAAARKGLEAALAELATLDAQRVREGEARLEHARLEEELKNLTAAGRETQEHIDRLASETGQDCPFCSQPLTEAHRQTKLADLQSSLDARRVRYRDVQARIRDLAEESEALKSADRRRPQLEKERDNQQGAVGRYEAQLRHSDEALDSWDEQEGQARLAALEAALADDSEEGSLQATVAELRTAAEDVRQWRREHQQVAYDVARDETSLGQLRQAADQWQQRGRPELERVTDQLTQETYAQTERAALAEVLAQLAAVGYDEAGHLAAREKRGELEPAQGALNQLRQAEAAVTPLMAAIEETERQATRTTAQVADLRAEQERLGRSLRELEAATGDLRAAEAELARLRDAQSEAIRATSTARNRLEILRDQRQRAQQLQTERTALSRRLGLLRQLEEACGRKGVQALLIDRALPEIEEYANELLGRLSGHEMTVRFDATRTGKTTGEQIETLDIKIADGVGERPYENYSGGEKFRVNFAIRLALSQVLARRAGARLRTLVIDEGFGSQDPEGRQRLVEAINAVQSEFACILVITHIDELRDKFPARIDVEKSAEGSRLQVVMV